MTEDEARAERAEADRLIAEINHLRNQINRAIVENQNLQIELDDLIRNVEKLTCNARDMDAAVNETMSYLAKRIEDADISTAELFALIDDLTSSYFIFKNLSTASKNVTQFTDEYYTKFSFFNELRRITLGYVIGLDAHICSDETMKKKVEKAYLQNTEYWLAYAIMAVMLWTGEEENAAKRAMSKALSMDYYNAALFFLLINLRFTRVEAAKKWYLSYLDRINMEKLGNEWQYLLQAYLSGVFGTDREFQTLVQKNFTEMLDRMQIMHPDYGNKVIDKTQEFASMYIHVTDREFENLRRYCNEYDNMKRLLSDAEKNEELAKHFKKIMEDESELESNLFQRIEDILYDLINTYDKEEYKVIKNKTYNEMIIKAKGDLGMAQQYFNIAYSDENAGRSIDNLLFEWAFMEDETRVDINIRKFSIIYLKKWIISGFVKFAEDYRKHVKEKYLIEIDGWKSECNETSQEESINSLEKYYNKNRVSDTFNDKFVLIFTGMVVAALIILIITIFKFNKISLVIGILLGISGSFLLWRRIVDMQAILLKKCEEGILLLKKTLDELKVWLECFKSADKKNADLIEIFENIYL